MKIFSKIGLGIIIAGWICFAWFLFMSLGNEIGWVQTCGDGITNAWNTIFGTTHTSAGFFNRLEDVLYGFLLVFAPITLFFIILFVRVNKDDEAEEYEEKVEKKAAKKEEEKKMKLQRAEKKDAVKKTKAEKRAEKLAAKKAKIDEAAAVSKQAVDAGEKVSESVDSFLNFLNSKK